MPTCRIVIKDALRALKAIAPGDDPTVDELNDGLFALQNLVTEIHNARGPLIDLDVTAASYIPSQNQRVRIPTGGAVTITLPNAVPIFDGFDPYDYGFDPAADAWSYGAQGTTGNADGIYYRQPTDGARIEIVTTTPALYFWRADLNQWISAYGLTLDVEVPFNARYAGPLGAVLADRLMESLSVNEPSPGLAKRVARGWSALLMQTGARRAPVRIENF
jgi:hypothetical protein